MTAAYKILVVDDDFVLQLIASEMLEQAGYEVTTAQDGLHALKAMRDQTFDLILLDMLMPDKEGMETLLEIRARWPAMKVVCISGGGRIGAYDLLHWAKVAGADAALLKPLDRHVLIETVRDLLGQGPSLREAV